MTKAAGIEYIAKGIRVNAIEPGLVETNMTKGWLENEEMRKVVTSNTPIGRPTRPEEIAGMVRFLFSDAASYAAGQTFIVDAGQTAH